MYTEIGSITRFYLSKIMVKEKMYACQTCYVPFKSVLRVDDTDFSFDDMGFVPRNYMATPKSLRI